MSKRKLVVIGNGMAGARAVEEILKRGGADQFDVVMFGDEPHGNYNRIMLSGILGGTKTLDDILINTPDWYAENGIVLHKGDRVVEIDRAAKAVRSAGGRVESYDVLLIATGSKAFVPPFKGAFASDGTLKPGVFAYRTFADCVGIAEAAKAARKAVTIGGGLLGLEAARALGDLGCESHVVHLAGHLLELQLDATGGGMLRRAMEGFGLHVHTGKATTEVLGEDRVTGLAFKDGTTLDCDMVVVAAGVRPNSEIGLRAGLTVERAIVVNDHMQSIDDRSVYAVGECAQHRGKVYGLVAPLWDQAKVFAEHVTGRDERAAYHGSKLATKLKVMGVELASMGITEPHDDGDEVVQFAEPKRGTYKKLIVRNGRLVGGILMGDISKAAYLMQAFDRDAPLPEERLALLFDIGAPPQAVSLEEMPAEMQVCNCNGVTKGAIGACVAAGNRDLRAVMTATRAGMGCGSCKGQVDALTTYFLEQAPAPAAALAAEEPSRLDGHVQARILEDGTFSMMPDTEDGHCTPAQLLRIAEVAVRYNVPAVKLVGHDRIDLVGLPRDEAAKVWNELYMTAAE
ncbi:FAD-dependent oxidoreductase [Lichenibacterium dinghuense]|uniref:FAD-dependent oxidoreductase n=1 Tax=Lichenibacterium dinghuense TaxID=2895977 RepID=UPI001F27E548|nr:FAD-dependent oxidoreductase [Lichenibacterium sp. 6Y81]